MCVLTVKNVSYMYSDGNQYVLKDVSYTFEKGKMYSIKGRSGSGKTTLLSLISGLERYKEGSITFHDQEVNHIDLDHYRNTNVGIVFQSFNLLPHLTAIENIVLSMDISKVKVNDKRKKALELLNKVGLDEEKGNRRVLKLSGGEQQRVAIARSLSYDAEIILADEPTGNLDKETEEEIVKILIDLAHKEKKCVIIVTHSNNVAKQTDVVFELKKAK
ncbi:MAG: ABC transporter ATP-binding protein [bacterium]|nr:ABC transporter ATP-binding protein [bacterium]